MSLNAIVDMQLWVTNSNATRKLAAEFEIKELNINFTLSLNSSHSLAMDVISITPNNIEIKMNDTFKPNITNQTLLEEFMTNFHTGSE